MRQLLQRWLPLAALLTGLFLFLHFNLNQYLTFYSLKQHRDMLLTAVSAHYLMSVGIFIGIYIMAVALSFPGATFLTLAAGFLFGDILGTVYTVVGATIGALIIFLAVRTALEPLLAKKAAGWIAKMRRGFHAGEIQYLLILRLLPIVPFWVVNIVPGLLGVRTSVFVLTTFFGIIPGSFVYVLLGNGLGELFDQNKTPNLHIIFEPQILLPLLALALLSVLPSIYKYFSRKTP